MRRSRRGYPAAIGTALLLALTAGCAKDEPAPLAPPAAPAVPVEAVFPAARSTRVLYDTDIWVRFSEPLDPATVNDRTVFLKLDTVRQPAAYVYDPATWTIHLIPQVQLALLRTYTVEITTAVRTAAGPPLAKSYFWQFTTNGLRRLENPFPGTGATGASPFGMLRWGGTESAAGTIRYEVYAGADSAVVAARGLPAIGVVMNEAAFVPRASWGLAALRYWAVNSSNVTTGEHFTGPVWRFETLPAGTPVDSVVAPLSDWAYYNVTARRLMCMATTIGTFPTFNTGIRWRLHPGLGDLKLAGARLLLSVSGAGTGFNLAPYQPHIQAIGEAWGMCAMDGVLPRADGRGPIAGGTQIGTSARVRFEGDAFTAHLEAGVRFGYGHGYRLWANQSLLYVTPLATTSPATDPKLTLYYYRTGP